MFQPHTTRLIVLTQLTDLLLAVSSSNLNSFMSRLRIPPTRASCEKKAEAPRMLDLDVLNGGMARYNGLVWYESEIG